MSVLLAGGAEHWQEASLSGKSQVRQQASVEQAGVKVGELGPPSQHGPENRGAAGMVATSVYIFPDQNQSAKFFGVMPHPFVCQGSPIEARFPPGFINVELRILRPHKLLCRYRRVVLEWRKVREAAILEVDLHDFARRRRDFEKAAVCKRVFSQLHLSAVDYVDQASSVRLTQGLPIKTLCPARAYAQ